jgi:hypothetical protein
LPDCRQEVDVALLPFLAPDGHHDRSVSGEAERLADPRPPLAGRFPQPGGIATAVHHRDALGGNAEIPHRRVLHRVRDGMEVARQVAGGPTVDAPHRVQPDGTDVWVLAPDGVVGRVDDTAQDGHAAPRRESAGDVRFEDGCMHEVGTHVVEQRSKLVHPAEHRS